MSTLHYTSTTTANLRRVAVRAYIQHGGERKGAQAAWMAVRAIRRELRAPWFAEAVATNTGRRRSYRCPLGSVLGIVGASGEFGHHCAEYRRTKQSWESAKRIEQTVIDWLEAEACALA